MRALLVFLLLFSGVAVGDENPWDDRKITCDEMAAFPELVFTTVGDLGYGGSRPVDFYCPKSLASQDFLQPFLERTKSVRVPTPGHSCSSRFYQSQVWRFYELALSELGYYPQGILARKGKPKGERQSDVYFEEWSYHSLHNREIYRTYLDELEKVRPQLIQWYLNNHPVSAETAQRYADNALDVISAQTSNSYPYNWQPEALVAYTDGATEESYGRFLASLGKASDEQKLNSLRRLLFHSPSNDVLATLVASLSESAIKDETRSESPLSIAVNNLGYLDILLQAGFDPNHQNVFGKTPLYYAVDRNQHEAVSMLLAAGAEVNHTYQLEEHAPYNAFHCIGIKQWERTPLMHAAQHADTEMLRLLLDYNADPILKDSLGATAQDYARKNGKTENAEYLAGEVEK